MMKRLTIQFAVFLLALTAGAGASTKLILHDAAADVSGYRWANTTQGASMTTSVTNTVTSGTDIQVTKTAGGSTIAWITPPLAAGVTISGSATCNLWGLESNTAANASFRCRFYRYTGSEGSQLWIAQVASELTAGITNKTASAAPTSTAFSAGDRIVIKAFLENCSATSGCPTGTMGGSRTVTLDYDGASVGSDGDSYVQITENVGWAFAAGPSETHTTSDTNARLGGFTRTDTETVTAADSPTRLLSASVGPVETFSFSDAVGSSCGANSTISEAFSSSDSVEGIKAGGCSATYCRSDTETLSLSDALGRIWGAVRAAVETLTTADAPPGRLYGALREASETNSTSGSAGRVAGLKAALTETFTASDSAARLAALSGVASETLAASDSASGAYSRGSQNYERSVAENSSVSDSAARLTALNVPVAEIVAASDTAAAERNGVRPASLWFWWR